MVIKKQIYNKILKMTKPYLKETGGILGEENGIITHFSFDEGISEDIGCYIPNVKKLNNIINIWNENNIKFCGIIHSHINKQASLSSGDIEYIKKIMLSASNKYTALYFPLFVDGHIISYVATLENTDVYIYDDEIKISKKRGDSDE